ncbi:MAG: hypothetical protein Q8M01_03440 [Rubrivivax sp.]|nr:hypothetical protein [Rubrivivax sp.]
MIPAFLPSRSTIARLVEYRQALITCAVTGEIDVRAWQADKEAA